MSTREDFRKQVFERDSNTCTVPWCDQKADDAHHIIERRLWENGGYIEKNGASVCNKHHRYAESNDIPPQAFWLWLGIENLILPEQVDSKDINKWGDNFEKPPWQDLRDRIKYQSTRHILPLYWHDEKTIAEERVEHDDTGMESIENFIGKPLVITHKMDGSNCMLVNNIDNPVRARNGKHPEDTMKPLYKQGGLYWKHEVNQKLPDRLQVFGEWLYAKHSIHYGCNCDNPCEDIGKNLSDLVGIDDESAYFQIFGVYDKKYNLWLSWPKTKTIAEELGFPTTPEIYVEEEEDNPTFESSREARKSLIQYARDVVEDGGEGIVVRSKFPFHYSQFDKNIGKYVRENHVKTDDKHWKHKEKKKNQIKGKLPPYFN